jgi:hypothetical protein
MIFEPVEPVFLCCGWKIHGLFLQRQEEVAAEYGRVIATRVCTYHFTLHTSTLVSLVSCDMDGGTVYHRHYRY